MFLQAKKHFWRNQNGLTLKMKSNLMRTVLKLQKILKASLSKSKEGIKTLIGNKKVWILTTLIYVVFVFLEAKTHFWEIQNS